MAQLQRGIGGTEIVAFTRALENRVGIVNGYHDAIGSVR